MKPKLVIILSLSLSCSGIAQFNCGDSLYDVRDGQYYATIQVDSDCWFQQNLNYGTMVQSDSLGIIHSQQTNNQIPEKYAQNNDPNNLLIYGGLYEQAELMNYSTDPQGLCPNGWHVSTDAEWQAMINYAGGSVSAGSGGTALKATGTGVGIGAGTDQIGIALLPGGDRDGFGIFYGLGLRYIYWTGTSAGTNQAYHYTLWAVNDTIQRLSLGTMSTGFSCRCVKNAPAGLDEKDEIRSEIYPNPAENLLTIKSSHKFTEIRVMNQLGKLIEVISVNETMYDFNISHLASGAYLLFIKTNDDEWLTPHRFVKL